MEPDAFRRERIPAVRRLVVKVGSAVLTDDDGRPDPRFFWRFATEVVAARARGVQPVLVSSGAIASGRARLGWSGDRRTVAEAQAAAAVGQCGLIHRYETTFAELGVTVAQVLLTHADLEDRARYMNARATLAALVAHGVVPIINENDTVAVEEIQFGDNDQLSAMVAGLVDAELLVLLTTAGGLHERDPRTDPSAPVLSFFRVGDALPEVGGAPGTRGKGGMASKLQAVRTAARYGVPSVVADGRREGVLARILAGEPEGTLVLPEPRALTARKYWIACTLKPRGSILVDEGAVRAIVEAGKSLLPSGVRDVEGAFVRGDAVRIVDGEGREIARGLAAYGAADVSRIKGLRSDRIEAALGVHYADEVVHRDDLVVV